tara:strand:+ start:418 stop:759 length:342 start_codon:yes stop_codon:yes gene_type:complete
LEYKDGKLGKSINRKGIDVTNKIIKVQDISKQLAISGLFQVRGEFYTPHRTSNFSKRIASEFLQAKEGIGKYISFCGFQILSTRLNQFEAKKYHKKLGFSATHDIYCYFSSQI